MYWILKNDAISQLQANCRPNTSKVKRLVASITKIRILAWKRFHLSTSNYDHNEPNDGKTRRR